MTIAVVRYPEPGVTRLEGLTVAEPHGQQPLVQVARLDLRHEKGTWLAETGQITLAPGSHGLWPLLRRCAMPAPGVPDAFVQLLADRVTLHGSKGDTLLRQLAVLRSPANDDDLTVSFMVNEDATVPLRLELRAQADGALRAQLDTGAAELPSAVAAFILPDTARLGSKAGFRGTLDCTLCETGASGQSKGELIGIDLETLAAQDIPTELALRGTARLTLEDVRFQDGRITQAQGSFRAAQGTVGPGFIAAAVEALRLRRDPAAAAAAIRRPVPFGELAFDFTLDSRQFRMVGRCAGAPTGVLLTSLQDSAPLLTTTAEPQPPSSLARMFSPQSIDWVPATPQAQWLLDRLPRTAAPPH